MVITLTSGGTPYTLAHGPARGVDLMVGPADDLRHGSRAAIQIDQILNADAVTLANRKNLAGRLTFSATVEKATIALATEAAMKWPVTLPRAGTLTIVEGTKTITLTAGIEDVAAVQYGVSVRFTYSIVYGAATFSD